MANRLNRIYARDLKPGMVTRLNGRVLRVHPVVPQFYQLRPWDKEGEAMTVGVRFEQHYGVQVLAPHDVIEIRLF